MSTSYFVAADWLIEHGDDPEVQIIDARMAPPGKSIVTCPVNTVPGICLARYFLISKPSPITLLPAAHAAAPGSVFRGDARAGRQQRQTSRCL
jgi:3-mercaptopyruvate sulfurtransferase SseA